MCGLCNKRLLILSYEALAKLLLHYKEQAKFDGIDLEKIYEASRKEDKKPRKEDD